MERSHNRLFAFSAILSLAAFTLVTYFVLTLRGTFFLDVLVHKKILDIWSPAVSSFFLVLTEIGSPFVLLILSALIFLILVFKRRTADAVFLMFAMIFGAILVSVLKWYLGVPRPLGGFVQEIGYSFPSAHTTIAVIFFLSLIYIFFNHIHDRIFQISFTTKCFAFILAIAFSRIYIGVHTLSDVIAGMLLGIFCLSVSAMFSHFFCNRVLRLPSL